MQNGLRLKHNVIQIVCLSVLRFTVFCVDLLLVVVSVVVDVIIVVAAAADVYPDTIKSCICVPVYILCPKFFVPINLKYDSANFHVVREIKTMP